MPAATARAEPPYARASRRVRGRAFARVDISDDFEEARGAWAEIEASAAASPYQSLAFARDWRLTLGASQDVLPMIVVARDEKGTIVALLPLGRFRRGPLHLATFLGGRCANYQMGLFRPGVAWSRGEVEELLQAAARRAKPPIDAFMFISQPESWNGAANPLAEIPGQPSPSFAYASALPGSFEQWRDTHFSKASQKKFRKKAKKLEAIGPLSHARAAGAEQAGAFLEAFFAQKRARARALGLANEFEDEATIAMLERLSGLTGAGGGAPILELHALRAGERIVATFGGFADEHGLFGMIISHDTAPAVAASSPGELLIMNVARDAIERGLAILDLGVGEARYKNECCETAVPLFDSAFAVSTLGRLAAAGFLAARRLKRRVKQSPRLFAWALTLRRRLG